MFVLQTKGYGSSLRSKDMRLFTKIEEYLDYTLKEYKAQHKFINDYGARAFLKDGDEEVKRWFFQFLSWNHRLTILIPGELAPPAKTLKKTDIWDQMVEHGRDKALYAHANVLYGEFLLSLPAGTSFP